jgi:hypothetical protein
MAEERTLGLARARETTDREELSKEELQRRMEEARDSISNTVTEIKETVAQQVETVKEALDWREHFKKRPVAWSLGALGVGFVAGYGIAAAIKGEPSAEEDFVPSTAHVYAGQPILGPSQPEAVGSSVSTANGEKDEGPSLLERFRETSAYERLSKEVASLGDRLIDELSSTAQKVVLPAVLLKLKNWIGLDLSEDRSQESAMRPGRGAQSTSTQTNRGSVYEPVLERSS